MAKIIYRHPSQTKHDYHVYTNLDFWDARRILKDLATVRRNFGTDPPGDEFPSQVVADRVSRAVKHNIERRLGKAIPSPPRHVIVKAMLLNGVYEFDWRKYYPMRWSGDLILRFTYSRLPLEQAALSSPYRTVRLSLDRGKVRVERVQRSARYDPVVRNRKDAMRQLIVPSCF